MIMFFLQYNCSECVHRRSSAAEQVERKPKELQITVMFRLGHYYVLGIIFGRPSRLRLIFLFYSTCPIRIVRENGIASTK